jgi:RNA recognition motif-containing protein
MNLYKSIISVKIIFDNVTGKSKGFGFVEFSNYKEFNKALNNKNPVFLGKQKLVFNSGKNKYDDDDNYINFSKENIISHSDSTNSFNLTQQSSNGNSVFNSLSNSNKTSMTNSFIEENLNNNKPIIKNVFYQDEDEQFQIDISNAFKNVSKMALYSGKGNLSQCNYYCNYFLKKNGIEESFSE